MAGVASATRTASLCQLCGLPPAASLPLVPAPCPGLGCPQRCHAPQSHRDRRRHAVGLDGPARGRLAEPRSPAPRAACAPPATHLGPAAGRSGRARPGRPRAPARAQRRWRSRPAHPQPAGPDGWGRQPAPGPRPRLGSRGNGRPPLVGAGRPPACIGQRRAREERANGALGPRPALCLPRRAAPPDGGGAGGGRPRLDRPARRLDAQAHRVGGRCAGPGRAAARPLVLAAAALPF